MQLRGGKATWGSRLPAHATARSGRVLGRRRRRIRRLEVSPSLGQQFLHLARPQLAVLQQGEAHRDCGSNTGHASSRDALMERGRQSWRQRTSLAGSDQAKSACDACNAATGAAHPGCRGQQLRSKPRQLTTPVQPPCSQPAANKARKRLPALPIYHPECPPPTPLQLPPAIPTHPAPRAPASAAPAPWPRGGAAGP